MKNIVKKTGSFFCLILVLSIIGCGASTEAENDFIIINEPEKIVPAKENLVENLEDSGYTITEYTDVEGSDLTIDRVVAEKGSKFIDITYGLTSEDAEEIFKVYCEIYDSDYYILAMNGNYVYCVSDKKTFKKAGFSSTANIGVQYIND